MSQSDKTRSAAGEKVPVDKSHFSPAWGVCEWPGCKRMQAGLMRYCQDHGHRILLGELEAQGDYSPVDKYLFEDPVAGFTGTREGMSEGQMRTMTTLLGHDLSVEELHHGECVGADTDANWLARASGIQTVGHPPLDQRFRSVCTVDEQREAKGYLERDRDIVDESSFLIATPKEATEQEKGGTWYTVRYARSQGRPVLIVWPDGSVTAEPEWAHYGRNQS